MASGIYGISAYSQTFSFNQNNSFSPFNKNQKNTTETTPTTEAQRLREMIRNMKRTQSDNPYAVMPENAASALSTLSGTAKSEEEEELQKVSKYNYKEVANKILRAKTALSAGQAVISAKRKVIEVKRKISIGDGDPEELQIALTHAKRMEIAAKKKKRHLEMEELVVAVQKRDEKLDQMEEAASDIRSNVIDVAQEELTKQEDVIFDERKEMLDEVMKQQEEKTAEISEEEMAKLNEMIAEFGEDELQELQEAMDLLESMEIINPHMSKEDLEELKRKHRNEEYKAIMKAEMDYLKDMIKYIQEKSMSAMGSGPSITANTYSQPALSGIGMVMSGAEVSASGGAGMAMSSIDVQV
ncbi:MAG: hypothetical protein E7289_09095 [Lachnospiraceae bacterium]|nr:hypothetical protein [Lachnospiraceae bacterium]